MGKKDNKYSKATASLSEGGIFGLGRPIDFTDGITRIALICTILTAVAATFWKTMGGADTETAMYFGLNTAAAFFFSWLIAQELDPDRKLGGIIGGGLSIIAAFTLGEGNVLVLLWLLFILRMLNRTSGSRHKIGDNVLLIFIAYWLGRDGYWLYPVLTGTAYIIESQIKGGYYRSLYLGGLAFSVTAMADTSMKAHSLSMIYVYLMALCFILFLPEIRMAALTEAKGDIDGKRISTQRLQVAQGAFLMIGFSLPWVHGETQAAALTPAWMAGIGVGVYLLVDAIQKAIFEKNKQ